MENVQRTRVIIATSEKLTVWQAKRGSTDIKEPEKILIECPHCGEEAFLLEVERTETPEVKVVGNTR